MKFAKSDRCDSGYILIDYDARLWELRFHQCPVCKVWILPDVVRWLDPHWLKYVVWERGRWRWWR